MPRLNPNRWVKSENIFKMRHLWVTDNTSWISHVSMGRLTPLAASGPIIKSHQCQLLTLVASALSSTIQRGSPSPHLAMAVQLDIMSRVSDRERRVERAALPEGDCLVHVVSRNLWQLRSLRRRTHRTGWDRNLFEHGRFCLKDHFRTCLKQEGKPKIIV